MARQLLYGAVRDGPRKAIHVVRLVEGQLKFEEVDEIAARMRERALSRYGDQAADVVVVQGSDKNTLRLFGNPRCVSRVRAAMFSAALSWTPIELN